MFNYAENYGDEPDRTWRNSSDGEVFYGFDSDDGKTAWYDKYGNIDSITDTPTDDEQSQNDEGY